MDRRSISESEKCSRSCRSCRVASSIDGAAASDDMNRQYRRIAVAAGLMLTLYSDSDADSDLEVNAVTRWIEDSNAKSGGYWVGEFDPQQFRDVPVTRKPSVSEWFPCCQCGEDLTKQIKRDGLSPASRCGECGTRVHSPIAAPAAT